MSSVITKEWAFEGGNRAQKSAKRDKLLRFFCEKKMVVHKLALEIFGQTRYAIGCTIKKIDLFDLGGKNL